MSTDEIMERWALDRAQQILLHEGVKLMNAAQWLDKNQTRRSSQALRDAIQQSLIEALAMAKPGLMHGSH